jgi:hypothetical protein
LAFSGFLRHHTCASVTTQQEDEQTANNNSENSNGAPKPSLRQSNRNVTALSSKTAASPTLAGGAHGAGGSLWLWGQGRNASLEGSGYNLERPCVLSGIPSPVVDVACSSTHALFLVGASSPPAPPI